MRSDGLISGNTLPQYAGNPISEGTYNATITATNALGSSTAAQTWIIKSPGISASVSYSYYGALPGDTVTIYCSAHADGGLAWTENKMWTAGGLTFLDLGNRYVGGTDASYSNTYTIPSQTGTYVLQLRVRDQFGNWRDFSFPLNVSAQQQSIPYSTTFDSFNPGRVGVQDNWLEWQGIANVVTDSTQSGTQSVRLDVFSQLTRLQKTFTSNASDLFVDFWVRPAAISAGGNIDNSSIVELGMARLGFGVTAAGQGSIFAYNGNGAGAGSWVNTGKTFAVDGNGLSPSWLHVTSELNYATNRWNVFLNGVPAASYGSLSNSITSFSNVTFWGTSFSSWYLDTFSVSTSNPFIFSSPATWPSSAVSALTDGSFTITWNSAASPFSPITNYQVLVKNGTATVATVNTTGMSVPIPSLYPDTTYTVMVLATNAASQSSSSAGFNVKTLPDQTPPSAPGSLGLNGTITLTSVPLTWGSSSDNVGVTGYKVYRGSTLVSTQTGLTFTDTGLSMGTTYTYTVYAYDARGNTSPGTSYVVTTGYALSVTSGSSATAYLLNGQSTTVTANAPQSGYVFDRWTLVSGTGTLADQYNPSTSFTLNASANATIKANYKLDPNGDMDGDGIKNSWEQQYGLDPFSPNDAYTDLDGDGLTNIAEYNLGKNPTVYDNGTSTLGSTVPAGWATLVAAGAATEAVNMTAGKLDVDKSGAATYSIPIACTPGTAGMEPKFTLNYSSQAGAGLAGFGWSLGGLSSVSRGGQTRVIDGQPRGIDFTLADRFYLDGQRLILVSGTYGLAGSEYRTEIESFSRIVAYGSAGNGPSYFRVWTKAGLVMDYGRNDDSRFRPYRLENGSFVAKSEALSWALSRVYDTAGNYMEFVYDKDEASGTQLLNRINYTGHSTSPVKSPYASIRFEYENRADAATGYTAGARVVSNKRLSKIKSCYGESVMRTYTLTYVERPVNGRSILTSLTEAGSDGKVLPALVFDYTNPDAGWDSGATWAPPAAMAKFDGTQVKTLGTGFIDVNGDGRPDFVQFIYTPQSRVGHAWLNKPSGWEVADQFAPPWPLAWDNGADQRTDGGSRWVDLNGDGLIDFVVSNNVDNYAYLNTGSGFQRAPSWDLPVRMADNTKPDIGRRFLDVNGDGLPDIVYYYQWADPPPARGGPGVVHIEKGCYLNTGSGWSPLSDAYTPPLPILAGTTASQFVDVNGDGLPDQVIQSLTTGIALNTGSGWNLLAPGSADFTRYLPPIAINGIHNEKSMPVGAEFTDLNGDGLADLVKNYSGASSAYINTGAGWIEASAYAPPYQIMDNWEGRGIALLDVNNDGLPDFVRAWWNWTPEQATLLNTGSGWSASQDSYNLTRQIAQPGRFNTGTDFVDLNADGAIDEAWNYQDDGSNNASLNRCVNPDRLVKVTNGFGVKVEISFKPLTDTSVYTKANDLTGVNESDKVANVVGPIYVVSQLRHDDGTGGTYNVNYVYGGLRSHRDRGSLGFATMQVTDSRSGVTSKTWFSQNYPCVGQVTASETRKSDNGLLSQTIVSYTDKPLNTGKTHFVYANETIQKGYELDGTLMTESDTTTQYDDWGNATRLEVDTLDGYDKVTTSTYENWTASPSDTDLNGWLLGRLKRSEVAATAPSVATQTRVSSFDYNTSTGLLNKEVVEPDRSTDAANYTLTTTYSYDEYGNKKSATTSGGGFADRTVTTSYDDRGRFPSINTNALSQSETYGYDQALGVLTSTTGPNGLTTSWEYDSFGRKIKETRADATVTVVRYKWAGVGAPLGSKYLIETETTGSAPSAVFYDSFGRPIYSYGLNGGLLDGLVRIVGVKTEYDSNGRTLRTSQPFYLGDTPQTAAETTSFDVLDRPLQVKTADEDVTGGFVYSTIEYAGLTAKATNPKGQRTETTKNQQGQVVKVVSNAGAASDSVEHGEVKYGYDAFGNLTTTSVRKADGSYVATTVSYDVRGRKAAMSDPDMGNWSYKYDALGELISQTDPKSQTVTMSYDKLGRMTSRVEAEGTTTWVYDTAAGAGVGKIAFVSSPGSYSESYSYDALGRPSTVSRVVDGSTYTTTQAYDGNGRPTITTYPSGFKVKNVYNALGFLKEVREAGGRTNFLHEVVADQVFWQADRYALSGQIDGSRLGNGLTYDRVVSSVTGRVKAITSGIGAGTAIQYHSYNYDVLGNVTRRLDSATGRDEGFIYDGLNRLTVHTVSGGPTVTETYDALGNITNKLDVGAYTYGGPRPHAVTSAGGYSCSYDEDGNMVSDGTRNYTWTSFNQVKKITQGGINTQFSFGAGHERVLQQHSNGTKTIYIGSLYEKVSSPGGLTEEKHYIYTPLGRTAVRSVRNDGSVETRYFHQDGLGSIYAVTDELGRVEKRFTFDAWGKRVKTADTHTGSGGTVTRGYTDHEQMEDFGLIHMNGRIYDPTLGRFISADPFVEDAKDSQAFNRYSYVSNNPLNATDPSGFLSLKEVLPAIIAVVVTAVVIVAVVMSGGTLAAGTGFFQALGVGLGNTGAVIAGGAAGGFASSFSGSLLNGGSLGDAFKAGVVGAAVGAATAYLSYEIGGYFNHLTGDYKPGTFGNWTGRTLAHGCVGGLASESQGGEFRHGFYSSAASAGIMHIPAVEAFMGGNAGGWHIAARTAAAAAIGGTASAIGGGKFANGATTAAFQQLFNQEATKAANRDAHPKSVAWVYVSADHAEVPAQADASLMKDLREQSDWLRKDMEVDDRNTRLNPFRKDTNYLSDGDRFDAFVIKQGDNYDTMRLQLKSYDRVYVVIHGTTRGQDQLYYFNGMKINEAGLSKMIPNMTEHFGCRVSAATTSSQFFNRYTPITRDYLRY